MPDNSVELPEWLAVDFLKHFRRKVESLAKLLSVEHEIYDDLVELAHAAWVKEIAQGLRDGTYSNEDPDFWIRALGRLGVRLCRGRCVTFGVSHRPLASNLTAYQSLILNFNEEYAALDFIRSLHMELYYKLQNNTRELRSDISSYYAAAHLDDIFKQLRIDPQAISRYTDLLNLPWMLSH